MRTIDLLTCLTITITHANVDGKILSLSLILVEQGTWRNPEESLILTTDHAGGTIKTMLSLIKPPPATASFPPP